MQQHTAATFAQRRYGVEIVENAAFRCRLALASAAIDPADLSALMRADKLAAAEQLAALDDAKLVVQAICCASFVNETYGFDAGEGVQTEEMLERFQQMVAAYRASRVEV